MANKEREESSVVFSLAELMKLEQARIRDEAESAKRKKEAAALAREAELRAEREREAARLRDEERAREERELRRRMDEAQIEAAKLAQIERARLAAEHQLQVEVQAHAHAHERALAEIQSKRRKGVHPLAFVGLLLALAVASATLAHRLHFVPKQEAKEAVARAASLATSDDPDRLSEASHQLAIARAKDPNAPGIAAVALEIEKKNAAIEAAEVEARKKEAAKIEALTNEIERLKKAIEEAKTASDKVKLDKQLEDAKHKLGLIKPKDAPPPPPKCPPGMKGVPLANCP